jgi:hypothetical protein
VGGQIVDPRPGGNLGERGDEPIRQVRETLMRDTLTFVGPRTHQHGQALPLLALNGADLGLLGLLRLDRRAEPSQPLHPPACRPFLLGCLVLGRRGCVIHCPVIGHSACLPRPRSGWRHPLSQPILRSLAAYDQ